MKKAMVLTVALGWVLGLGLVVSNAAFADESALEQLKRMAGGEVHTGKGFDGSPNDQKRGGIDTNVNSSTTTVVTPSTGTAGGYDVEKSSSTGTTGTSKEKKK